MGRVSDSSSMRRGRQDPMPDYIDPELVKLVAQNAPFDLDLFMRSSGPKRRTETNYTIRGHLEADDRTPLGLEAILSSSGESNEHPEASKCRKEFRYSCPERLWSDHEEDGVIWRAKAVKRKRPKSLERYQPPSIQTIFGNEVSLQKDSSDLRTCGRAVKVASPKWIDQKPNCAQDGCLPHFKPKDLGLSGSPATGNHCQMMSSKPWRHGMRKGKRSTKDDKSPQSAHCSRGTGSDSRKSSEVRKFMETKETLRRKIQQELKAEAEAALAARKEQQRKLESHRQAMLQSQVTRGKSREHTPRPAWVSDHTVLGEPSSNSSSRELNIYLPPPATPPRLEPVPLDLYTTRSQYAQEYPPTPRADDFRCKTNPVERRRSKKITGCSREVQRQLKYLKSRMHITLAHTEHAELAVLPAKRKARWKAKTKPLGRKLFAGEVSQLQLAEHKDPSVPRRSRDLDPYKKNLRMQFYQDSGASLSRPVKASGEQKSTKRSSQNFLGHMNDSCVMAALRDHVHVPSKVKRLKPTERFIACEPNELTMKEVETSLNEKGEPFDRESDTHVTVNDKVIAERITVRTRQSPTATGQEITTDLRLCVGHSLRSPQHDVMNEDGLEELVVPSLCNQEKFLTVPWKNAHSSGSCPKLSRSKRADTDVTPVTKEETDKSGQQNKISKDPTGTVWRQRMLLLKSLADQLAERVDAACAKKHEVENTAVEQVEVLSLGSHLNTNMESLVQLGSSGSIIAVEPLGSEPKFLHQPQPRAKPFMRLARSMPGHEMSELKFLDETQQPPAKPSHLPGYSSIEESELKLLLQPTHHDILHCEGLTELEQAGCLIPLVQTHEVKPEIQPGVINHTLTGTGNTAAAPPVSEICTVMDWNTTDKSMDVTCNIPSACSSFGPSSPSTGSSSPVILPTSTKYHMGRIKHSKVISRDEQTRKGQNEYWSFPVEKDRHSIINLYTEHWKSTEREKLATSAYPHVAESGLKYEPSPEMDTVTPVSRPATREITSECETVPVNQKLTFSEFHLKASEREDVQIMDHVHKYTQLSGNKGEVPDSLIKQEKSLSSHECLQQSASEADATVVTSSAGHPTGYPGPRRPGVMLVDIGDLRFSQTPTSFHLRLDRCRDHGADRRSREHEMVNDNVSSKMDDMTSSSKDFVGCEATALGESPKNVAPPLKITYARRFRSRKTPDGGCTDDERIVVKLQHSNGESPSVQKEGITPEVDPREETFKETRTSSSFNGLFKKASAKVVKGESAGGRYSKELDSLRQVRGNGVGELVTLQDGTELPVVEQLGSDLSCNEMKVIEQQARMNHLELENHRVPNSLNLDGHRDRGSTMGLMTETLPEDHTEVLAFDEEIGSAYAGCSVKKTEVGFKFNQNGKLDLLADLHDSEELALKLRRNQLETELQNLDIEIRKTRTRLQQSYIPTPNQVQFGPSGSSTDNQLGCSLDLDGTLEVGKQSRKHIPTGGMHSTFSAAKSDPSLRNLTLSPLHTRTARDISGKDFSSNSYSDSFASEGIEMEQSSTTRQVESSVSPLQRNEKFCSLPSRTSKSLEHEFGAALVEDRNISKNDTAAQSSEQPNCTIKNVQNDFTSEESDNSRGIRPLMRRSRLLLKSGEDILSGNERPGSMTLTGTRDPVVNLHGGGLPWLKEEREGRFDAALAIISPAPPWVSEDMSEISGRVQQAEPLRVTPKNDKKIIKTGTVENQNSSCECADLVTTIKEKSTSSQQIMMTRRFNDDELSVHDDAEVLRWSGGDINEVASSGLSVPKFPTFKIGSGNEPVRELGTETPKEAEYISRKTTATTQSLTSEENTMIFVVAADVLPHIPVSLEGDQSCNVTFMNKLKLSECTGTEALEPMGLVTKRSEEKPMQNMPGACLQYDVESLKEVGDQMVKKVNNQNLSAEVGQAVIHSPTCNKVHQNFSMSGLQVLDRAVLSYVNSPCGPASKDADWQSLSSPFEMDFSTIKERSRMNKLVHSSINDWSSYHLRNPLILEQGSPCLTEMITVRPSSTDVYASDLSLSSKISSELSTCLEVHNCHVTENRFQHQTKASGERFFLNSLPANISGLETIVGIIDQEKKISDIQGLSMLRSSLEDPPAILTSRYLSQKSKVGNPSEDVASAISEDLENYESDIVEDLEGDTVSESSSDEEKEHQWSPVADVSCGSTISEVACCLAIESPDLASFYPEPIENTKSRLAFQVQHAGSNNMSKCNHVTPVGGILHRACTSSDGHRSFGGYTQRLLSSQVEEQSGNPPVNCDGNGTSDLEMIGSLQQISTASAEEDHVLEVVKGLESCLCGSPMSASNLQFEGAETLSGALRRKYGNIYTMELNTKTPSNEEDDLQKDVGKRAQANVTSGAPECYVGSSTASRELATAVETPNRNQEPNCSRATAICLDENNDHETMRTGEDNHQKASVPVQPFDLDSQKLREVNLPCAKDPQEASMKCPDIPFFGVLSLNTEGIDLPCTIYGETCLSSEAAVKITASTFSNEESCRVRSVDLVDVKKFADDQIVVGETFDFKITGDPPSHPVGLVKQCSVDCLFEDGKKVGQDIESTCLQENDGPGETSSCPSECASSDISETTATKISNHVDDDGSRSDYSTPGLPKFGSAEGQHQAEGLLDLSNVLQPWKPASKLMYPVVDSHIMVFNHEMRETKIHQPVECCVYNKIGSNNVGYSLENGKMRDSPSSYPSSVEPGVVIVPESYNTPTISTRSPLSKHQLDVIDSDHDAMIGDERGVAESILEYNYRTPSSKSLTECDGFMTQISPSTSSLTTSSVEVSQHGATTPHLANNSWNDFNRGFVKPSGEICSGVTEFMTGEDIKLCASHLDNASVVHSVASNSFSGFVKVPGELSESVAADTVIIGVIGSPIRENIECYDSCSGHEFTGKEVEERASPLRSGSSERLEDVGNLNSGFRSISRVPQEDTLRSCFADHEDECRWVSSSAGSMALDRVLKIRSQTALNKTEKQDLVADIVTNMLYEDLLSQELSGFPCHEDRILVYREVSQKTDQTTSGIETGRPKLKRKARRVPKFCGLLKHFLPTGWRSLSAKHKTGSFLHVEGLKPYPLGPAAMLNENTELATLEATGQCTQQDVESQQFLHQLVATNTQPPLLEWDDVHSYVQSTFSLSSLILDSSPSCWYDTKTPVGEHIFQMVESQHRRTADFLDKSRWQVDSKLLADLINESLLKRFATAQIVPAVGHGTLPFQLGGHHLVEFVTTGIMEHESCAAKHNFNIEKVIGKVLGDEQWERCAEEARDLVADLAQDIYCDLIERFIHEMVQEQKCDGVSTRQDDGVSTSQDRLILVL